MFKALAIGLALIAGSNSLGLRHEDGKRILTQRLMLPSWAMCKSSQTSSSGKRSPTLRVPSSSAAIRTETTLISNTLVKVLPSLWPKPSLTELMKPTINSNCRKPLSLSVGLSTAAEWPTSRRLTLSRTLIKPLRTWDGNDLFETYGQIIVLI